MPSPSAWLSPRKADVLGLSPRTRRFGLLLLLCALCFGVSLRLRHGTIKMNPPSRDAALKFSPYQQLLRGDEEMTAKPVGGERGEEVSAQQWRARDEEPDLNALAAGEEAEEDTQAQEHEVKERRRGAKGDSFDTVKTLLDRQSAIDRIEMRIRNKFGEEVEGEQHQAPKGLQETAGWEPKAADIHRLIDSLDKAGVGNASKKAQKGRGAPRNAQDPGDELKGWVDSLFKGKEDEPRNAFGMSKLHNSEPLEKVKQSGSLTKAPNPAWIAFTSPDLDDARQQCLGAQRPWVPQTQLPGILKTTGLWKPLLIRRQLAATISSLNVTSQWPAISRHRGLASNVRVPRVHVTITNLCKKRDSTFQQKLPERLVLSAGQQALLDCLLSDDGCIDANPGLIRSEVEKLSGIKMLAKGPSNACFLTTQDGRCSSLQANPETGNPRTYLNRAPLPARTRASTDLNTGQLTTCALVSNGPLVKVVENGEAIDAHQSVWRFNLMDGGAAQHRWAGRKTTIRMFNRLRGLQAAGVRTRGPDVRLKDTRGERWLYWSSASAAYLAEIKTRYPDVEVGLLHGTIINWILDVYFRIRQDLAELGLTFPCPRNLSSGIHSLIIATQICRRVNMFGFTYSTDVLKTRPGHMDKPHTMHDAHSWENDVMLIRLLHLAGLINICTADDPSMDLQTIRSGETLVV